LGSALVNLLFQFWWAGGWCSHVHRHPSGSYWDRQSLCFQQHWGKQNDLI